MATLSFGGCGWLLSYGLGVAKSSQKLLRDVPWFHQCHFAGSSGGGLVAAVLASGTSAETVQHFVWEAARRLESLPFNSFRRQVGPELSGGMDRFFPVDAHLKVRDRLHVSITRLEGFIPRNRLISEFTSRQHLVDTLRTSCHIPGYTNSSLKWLWHENAWHFDGGLTDNAPIITPHTYRISPFTHPDTYDVSPYYPHPCYTFTHSQTSPLPNFNDPSTLNPPTTPTHSQRKFEKPGLAPPASTPSEILSNVAAAAPFHPIMPTPSLDHKHPDHEDDSTRVSHSAAATDFEPFNFTTAQLLRYAAWPKADVLERVFQKGVEDGELFAKLLLSHSSCELCQASLSKLPLAEPNTPTLVPARFITPWIWSRLPRR